MKKVLALSGGIGGAKLALGLQQVLGGENLTIIANTGDDFTHLGLPVSPDIDTLVYTLAGLGNRELGWGRAGETWTFMGALKAMGGPGWFQLGDGDLAMHVLRAEAFRTGETLTAFTARIARNLGLAATILPMSDDPVRTKVRTAAGWLDFQDYFVGRQCAPAIDKITFEGAEKARLNPALHAALAQRLDAIVICPSNPFISIGPILAVPGLRAALKANGAPVVAVSPIIGGKAVKGPTGKMMAELGLPVTSGAAMQLYDGLPDAVVCEPEDAGQDHGAPVFAAPTLMRTDADKAALARFVLEAAASMADSKRKAS